VLAKRQSITNPKNTVFSVKRLIGRKFSDQEVQRDKNWMPYEILEGEHGGVQVRMGEKNHTPEEISAFILAKLKSDAEAKLGEKIEEAVITVPAYFDDSQRPGDQERRRDRRPQGAPHPERTDRRGPGIRAEQA